MLFSNLLLGFAQAVPTCSSRNDLEQSPTSQESRDPKERCISPFLICTEQTRADSLQETQVLNSSNKLLKTPNRCFCVFPAPYAGCVEAPADLQKSRCMSHTCFNVKAQVIGKGFITTLCACILSSGPEESDQPCP